MFKCLYRITRQKVDFVQDFRKANSLLTVPELMYLLFLSFFLGFTTWNRKYRNDTSFTGRVGVCVRDREWEKMVLIRAVTCPKEEKFESSAAGSFPVISVPLTFKDTTDLSVQMLWEIQFRLVTYATLADSLETRTQMMWFVWIGV